MSHTITLVTEFMSARWISTYKTSLRSKKHSSTYWTSFRIASWSYVVRTTVDLEKTFNGVFGNPIVKVFMNGYYNAIDFEPVSFSAGEYLKVLLDLRIWIIKIFLIGHIQIQKVHSSWSVSSIFGNNQIVFWSKICRENCWKEKITIFRPGENVGWNQALTSR